MSFRTIKVISLCSLIAAVLIIFIFYLQDNFRLNFKTDKGIYSTTTEQLQPPTTNTTEKAFQLNNDVRLVLQQTSGFFSIISHSESKKSANLIFAGQKKGVEVDFEFTTTTNPNIVLIKSFDVDGKKHYVMLSAEKGIYIVNSRASIFTLYDEIKHTSKEVAKINNDESFFEITGISNNNERELNFTKSFRVKCDRDYIGEGFICNDNLKFIGTDQSLSTIFFKSEISDKIYSSYFSQLKEVTSTSELVTSNF